LSIENCTSQSIGLFDSGVGGLSVMRAVAELLPAANIVYVADSAHCPYGRRSPAEIREFSVGITRFLLEQGSALIVVACNTASAAALAHLRETFPQVPFVGMVPAVKPAVSARRPRVVGVLATPVTVQGALLSDVVQRFAANSRVITQVCAGLVEQIEAGRIAMPDTRDLLLHCLEPMLKEGMDTLVLGCTHYPFVIPLIRELAGPDLRIVTAEEAVARQTRRVLSSPEGFREERGVPPSYHFVTTAHATSFARVRDVLVPALRGPVWEARWRDGEQLTVAANEALPPEHPADR